MLRIVYVHHTVDFGDMDIHINPDCREVLIKTALIELMEYHRNAGNPPTMDDYLPGMLGTCIDVVSEQLNDLMCECLYTQLQLYIVNFIAYIEQLMNNNKTHHILYYATTHNRIIIIV